ncbi:MAG: lysophospholipid acyltransferase family protein [Pseudomonadales bacterium]|nr:1-acyl-sn-glycerol-3-phosphate acyltransferase [Pseudomonadales bacterium]
MMLRSAAFYLGYSLATIVWGALSVLFAWILPYRQRFAFVVGCWTRFSLWWLRITCGIGHQIEGLEHLPTNPCVVMCRHESTWETLFLQTLLAPQATLIKRELLWIPFFGWAFALLRPIAIDRNKSRGALKRLIRSGRERLDDNIWVVMFPEGTRMPPGKTGRFQVGGAALASAAGSPLVVIAHDAGRYWPAHRFLKTPGTIRVKIAPPIHSAGRDSKALTREAASTTERLVKELYSVAAVAQRHPAPGLRRPG